MAIATGMDAGGAHPVTFSVAYPESLSRWKIFVKFLLAIPHLVVLYALSLAAGITTLVAWFAILFTGKYPDGLFKFAVGVQRWNYNVNVYTLLLRDEYPPFSMDAGLYPVTYEVDYPDHLSRLLIFVKFLLALPNAIVLLVVLLVACLASIVAWFAILFTGKYPRGIFDFVSGALRWNARLNAYTNLMTDTYPPFSLD